MPEHSALAGLFLHEPFHFVQETEPTGEIGAGKYWLKLSTKELKRRNPDNSGWDIIASPVVLDHGSLTGLEDDDHLQYHTDERGDIRYFTKEEVTEALNDVEAGVVTDHGSLTGLGDDDHTQYHNDARGDLRYFTQAQVTAAIATAIADLIASSPELLNTFYEFAAALGNDPNFATTIASALAAKAPLSGAVLTGASVNGITLAGTGGSTLNVGAGGTLQSGAFSAAGAGSFIGLTDVPANFTSSALKAVRVNAAANALEFYTPAGGVTAFIGLSDVPAAYTGQGGKLVAVKTDVSGLEFIAPTGGEGAPTDPAQLTRFNLALLI